MRYAFVIPFSRPPLIISLQLVLTYLFQPSVYLAVSAVLFSGKGERFPNYLAPDFFASLSRDFKFTEQPDFPGRTGDNIPQSCR
jgi:hypothetical protein